jgi:hypothetical protein
VMGLEMIATTTIHPSINYEIMNPICPTSPFMLFFFFLI